VIYFKHDLGDPLVHLAMWSGCIYVLCQRVCENSYFEKLVGRYYNYTCGLKYLNLANGDNDDI